MKSRIVKLSLTLFLAATAAAQEIRVSQTLTNFVRDDDREIVIDHLRGLMWQDDSAAEDIELAWDAAVKHCEHLDFAGFDDWYLPDIKALESISQPSNFPYAAVKAMQRNSRGRYWSSTVSGKGFAWYVDFEHGNPNFYNKSYENSVRCVRTNKESVQ